ncbi:MAG: MFS transporter [Elainellaceae cyanobacterium]
MVQGAITLSWVIYNLYLSQLLTQQGFPAGLAAALIVIETGAAVILEPLMGSLSDQTQRWFGSRFPMVAIGVILASLCFVSIPLSLIAGNPINATRWLLPVAAVLWAFSMTVFRSPVLSLLGRYAMATQQPQAASILTLVGGVAGALAPLASEAILAAGPLATFLIGSLIMLGSAVVLRSTNPDQSSQRTPKAESRRLSPMPLVATFGTGVGVNLGLQILLVAFAAALDRLTANPNIVMGAVFIAIAALAFPTGTLARRLGMFQGIAAGLGGLALLSLGSIFIGTLGVAVLLAIAIGGSISLMSNCTVPVALASVPPERAGLGTGLYFGGAALSASLFNGMIRPAEFSNSGSMLLAAAAFLFAIALIQPIRQHQLSR